MVGENFRPFFDEFDRDFVTFAHEAELQARKERTPTITLDGDLVDADEDELRILLDEHMAETIDKMRAE